MTHSTEVFISNEIAKPLQAIQNQIIKQQDLVKEWFQDQWRQYQPPIYGSVDLRNAGFKLAPIDMNLFPAGFNNLNPNYLSLSIEAAKASILVANPNAKNILLIPESHSRNLNYWSNIQTLTRIIEQAGFKVMIGTLDDTIIIKHDVELDNGTTVSIHQLTRLENKLSIGDFFPDLIILNNDLSDGIPTILENLDQVIQPPAKLGWSERFKSNHFKFYSQVAKEFSEKFDLDPWTITPLFRYCGNVNFMLQEGLNCVIHHAEELFDMIKQKYQQYNISHAPFLVVKADAGTYGMAVMTIRNVDELRNLNRKQRTKMSKIKGGQAVRRVIIQEGVYTFETLGSEQSVAEPVVYAWGGSVTGGFYRVHESRGRDENLNAPGMHFAAIAFSKTCQTPCEDSEKSPEFFFIYGIIAQLSMLAAAREIQG